MKPLTLEEVKLKEEMKERCLAKGQYIDENAKAKFAMLCHLEDFEVQYWELKKKNKKLKEKLDKYENPEDMTLMMMWSTEKVKDKNKELKKQLEEKENQQKEFIEYLEKENEKNKHYKTLYQSLKRQKDDGIDWIKNNFCYVDKKMTLKPFSDLKDLLRMLGEIDEYI